MPDEEVQSKEREQAAKLRRKQNNARRLEQVGQMQTVAGKGMKVGGQIADKVGEGVRKGGQKMMQAGAKMSSTGLGAIAGVPLMAAGGLTSTVGAGAQGAGKLAKGVGRGVEKGGRVVKLKARALEKKIAKKKEQGGITSALEKKVTGSLLKSAWLNLIPSWGLTLFYINLHVFLSWTFPKQFCKLGQEWPKTAVGGGMKKTAVSWGENMLLVSLDLLAFFAIFGITAIIVFIAAGPWGLLKAATKGIIDSIINMF